MAGKIMPQDDKIIDNRDGEKLIWYSKNLIPTGEKNTLLDIIFYGRKVGEIEIGTDGFVHFVIDSSIMKRGKIIGKKSPEEISVVVK